MIKKFTQRTDATSALAVKREAHHGLWDHPTVIAPNKFKNKSLSNWACNIAVGCSHGCMFCYVPSVSTMRLKPKLADYGVTDPDGEVG